MEFFEWVSVGSRWLPTLIALGMILYALVEIVQIIMNRSDKKEEE